MLVTRPFFRIEFLVILALQVPRPPRVILVKNELYKKNTLEARNLRDVGYRELHNILKGAPRRGNRIE